MPTTMRKRRRPPPGHRVLAAGLLCAFLSGGAGVGCDEKIDGGPVDPPYEGPGFTLPDLNPYSPTYLESLSPEDARGGVLVLYFASYT